MMMKTKAQSYLLALILMALCVGPGWADKFTDTLDAYIASPYPDSASTDPMKAAEGKLGYALATFKRPTVGNVTSAQGYIDLACSSQNPIPSTGEDYTGTVIHVAFALPVILRLYMDPALNSNLSDSNKTEIKRVLWQYIQYRSKVSDAQGTVWHLTGSENHTMIENSTYMLACQALSPTGDGYDGTLGDGQSIATHLAAWKKWFFEYFRQHGREGISGEIASVGYNKMTVGCWYNVYDLMDTALPTYGTYGDAALRAQAKKLLDLFWADYAGDLLPLTGLRGASGTRWYKNVLGNGNDGFTALLYCYNWHDNLTFPLSYEAKAYNYWHVTGMPMLVSAYRPPAIVDSIADSHNRTPYLGTTRRPGKGANHVNSAWTITFGANNASDIRRDVWWHPGYVMSAITLRTDKADTATDAYTHNIDHDRAMGVFTANDDAERIIFHGKEDGTTANTDYTAVTGICGERCMVVGWDKNAQRNDGVRLFVSNAFWNTEKIESGGWIFMRNDSAISTYTTYVAIRICEGTYTSTPCYDPYSSGGSTQNGVYLDLSDDTSPVIIEVASGIEHAAGYTDFRSTCAWQWTLFCSYDTATNYLNYYSLGGDQYEYWGNSNNLPKKNGTTVNLNPPKTLDTPYLSQDHGSDIATITYPGQSSLALDFNYSESVLWDDYQTKALWHMESSALDDDLFTAGRNNDLALTSVSYVAGKFGNCMDFNGTSSIATASYSGTGPKGWASYPTAKIDFWFKPDVAPAAEKTMVTATDTWDIRLNGSTVKMYLWNTAGGTPSIQVTNIANLTTQWHHVTGTVAADGSGSKLYLNVDGVEATPVASATAMKQQNAAISLGNKPTAARWYDGKLDDVKIRIYNLQ